MTLYPRLWTSKYFISSLRSKHRIIY